MTGLCAEVASTSNAFELGRESRSAPPLNLRQLQAFQGPCWWADHESDSLFASKDFCGPLALDQPPRLRPRKSWAGDKEETPSMLTLRKWFASLIVLAITAVPVMAGSNEAKPANGNAASAEPAAVPANPNPSPNLTATPGNTNVTALLGVLVMKGVLAPAEAEAIRNAAPEVEFQLLVEALNRKGVLSAADLSAAGTPAAQPAAAAVEVRESSSSSSLPAAPEASPQQTQTPPPQTKPQPVYPSR